MEGTGNARPLHVCAQYMPDTHRSEVWVEGLMPHHHRQDPAIAYCPGKIPRGAKGNLVITFL